MSANRERKERGRMSLRKWFYLTPEDVSGVHLTVQEIARHMEFKVDKSMQLPVTFANTITRILSSEAESQVPGQAERSKTRR